MMQSSTARTSCAHCGSSTSRLHCCSRCTKSWYCNRNCQRADYPSHRADCRETSRQLSLDCFALQDASTLGYDLGHFNACHAAMLLARITRWAYPQEQQMVQRMVQQSVDVHNGILPMVPPISDVRADPRSLPTQSSWPVRVHTDKLKWFFGDRRPHVTLVDCAQDADFYFWSSEVDDFTALPEHVRICRFPYEHCFVRKDLLMLSARRLFFGIPGDPSTAPSWWLPMFDLATEFHLFSREFEQRRVEGQHNRWILKPASGSRSQGIRAISGLAEAAVAVEESPGDLVAQLLVTHPMCVNTGHKFDCRATVFVRSFVPFEAYVHKLMYAKVASKPWDADAVHDAGVLLTSAAYSGIADLRENQVNLMPECLEAAVVAEYPDLEWAVVKRQIHGLLSTVFRSLAPTVGSWPRSRAYYGVDVLVSMEELQPEPKLLEINSLPDPYGTRNAARDQPEEYQRWLDLLVTMLCTDDPIEAHPDLQPL